MASAPIAETSEKRTVRSKDGTMIAYDRIGNGPAVILVGGAFIYREFPKPGQLAQRT